ncbi:MAG: glycosyltransferase, partial [Eubacterium sp.]
MKVRVYQGGLKIVEKSGIGKAIHHQIGMLKEEGIEVTAKNEKDVQIVHINTVFPDSPITAVLSRHRGQKVVVYAHSTEEDFRNSFRFSNALAPLFKRWICFCYNRGDVIITPTPYSGRLLKSYGIRKPIFPLSNGIDTDAFCPSEEAGKKFREKYGLRENEKVVMSVGHYIARKGIQEFIELARRMPDVRFFWFGYTSLNLVPDEIRKAIESAPDNLTLPGFVNAEELHEAYCGSDLFAFLSHEETEGIVVLEALASGIPVLV